MRSAVVAVVVTLVLGAIPEPYATVGEVAIWVAATITALGIVGRSPPLRWAFRKLVSDPVMGAFRQAVAEVVDERLDARPLTNGWGTATVAKIAEAVNADVDPPPAKTAPSSDGADNEKGDSL